MSSARIARAPAEQKRDAFDLMREEPLRQRGGVAERAVRVARRQRQQLREGVGLGVECLVLGHRLDCRSFRAFFATVGHRELEPFLTKHTAEARPEALE